MLQSEAEPIDLHAIKAEILKNAATELNELKNQYGLQAISDVESEMINIAYPVETYPTKIKSINLDKELGFEELLQGIKGQYLMFYDDRVINVSKYSCYHLDINIQ
jgi:ABC-type tungstate transport system permease subunit